MRGHAPFSPAPLDGATKMAKLLGIIGALVVCAGLDLLWQSRHEIRFLSSAYFRILRSVFRFQDPSRLFIFREIAQRRHSAVRFLLGMGFAFVLGPILIALGVTLMFYTNF